MVAGVNASSWFSIGPFQRFVHVIMSTANSKWAMKNPGRLGHIGDYTAQLRGDYNNHYEDPIKQSM